ncbi:hypothetical protein KTO58_10770 [Chitinophaga pendula]|uniref:hypothetical protein n=1 Tax=Chitinophaga TaxID=79328 RepID=UPI000BAE6F15|nr:MULTISPECIES: hypothetical protein [Chitinophaga]ASZ12736.1 hypothetical protein CK934_18130 [Chitinophaga sp. MD30]UCJ09646.1 hypothetical protein KTO58_10770 [Chitinophaga pendula]
MKRIFLAGAFMTYALFTQAQHTFDNRGNANVGIGTETPNDRLEVIGRTRLTRTDSLKAVGQLLMTSSDGNFLLAGSSMPSGAWNNITQAGDQALIYSGSNYGTGNLVIAPWSLVEGGSGMRLDKDGNVSIGLPFSAGYKLAVNGAAIFNRIKVKPTANWPDYVFHERYPLLPLSVLEIFIKTHHHLPEIPSAKEMERQELDVAEMHQQLLKKVEELTLYIIQQQKEIAELKTKVAAIHH